MEYIKENQLFNLFLDYKRALAKKRQIEIILNSFNTQIHKLESTTSLSELGKALELKKIQDDVLKSERSLAGYLKNIDTCIKKILDFLPIQNSFYELTIQRRNESLVIEKLKFQISDNSKIEVLEHIDDRIGRNLMDREFYELLG